MFRLGKLESEVMDCVWRAGEASVKEIHGFFHDRIAYTTVMTTLDRLFQKRLLDRRKDGRAFLYQARLTKEEFERNVATTVFGELLSRGAREPAAVLSYFVETVGDLDRQWLDDLDRLVKAKRRRLERNK